MAKRTRNIPLSIDDELLAAIDRVAEATKESRSAVMRRAIREGLPVVESGGSADVISLDSELSKDVDQISKEGGLSRAKVILECIRAGLQAFYYRIMREKIVHAQDRNPKEAEGLLATLELEERANDPVARELRTALRQRGAALVRLWDILMYVPEAWRRHQLIEKLNRIRSGPKGLGGGPVWGAGLSTEEIEWQIQMAEKYGPSGPIPEEEVKARDAARAREDKKHAEMVARELQEAYPPDWKP